VRAEEGPRATGSEACGSKPACAGLDGGTPGASRAGHEARTTPRRRRHRATDRSGNAEPAAMLAAVRMSGSCGRLYRLDGGRKDEFRAPA